jgi:hypothetical protein
VDSFTFFRSRYGLQYFSTKALKVKSAASILSGVAAFIRLPSSARASFCLRHGVFPTSASISRHPFARGSEF